ncbi:sporulation-specific N-acetylmuramoyl-L-alanine amidase CwlC [[Clostridium] sordellii]|uniref:N-acetylmuramoyl-L-alanine amidase n=1 Tax=Paraclostridium sordellii TaxID=1505 RepID=UPI0005E4CDFD|nr:N-acetylmuramoyl-L-alanine amidase [Paeniclostridium sordellii]CEP89724.1 sporulation-specific N-acetylmuramoyl-L-alanine amidase CwlC [[Clostridium] sordellii] [Paeniclostridium sordellii]
MRTNMTDAGHGGHDSGAIGVAGCLEKDIVLEVANKVSDYLKTQDIKNINTRNTDIFLTLSERSSKANSLGVNSFVSIHCNSVDNPNAQGLETYCYKFKYRALADAIHSEIIKEGLYTKNRGVKEGNLHVIRETNMDACLVELGFITNEEDYNLIMNNKDKFAKAIAKGICKFNSVEWKDTDTEINTEGFTNGDYSGRKAKVIADVLNVRWDRGTEYEIIGQVKYGDIVNLQYCLNRWVSIEGFKGNKGLGYVNSKYLKLI